MKDPVTIEIESAESSGVTPLELLEDFADCTGTWYYLEDESVYYARLKGAPACILKYFDPADRQEVDFAFVTDFTAKQTRVRLTVVDACSHPCGDEVRACDRFVSAFQHYLEHHGCPARLRMNRPEQPITA